MSRVQAAVIPTQFLWSCCHDIGRSEGKTTSALPRQVALRVTLRSRKHLHLAGAYLGGTEYYQINMFIAFYRVGCWRPRSGGRLALGKYRIMELMRSDDALHGLRGIFSRLFYLNIFMETFSKQHFFSHHYVKLEWHVAQR